MVTYVCPRCSKEHKQKSHLDKHLQRKTPCAPSPSNVIVQLKEEVEKLKAEVQSLKAQPSTAATTATTPTATTPTTAATSTASNTLNFIDLFSGIGGFHYALASLGAKCVLACDIDDKCREVYKNNFGLEPQKDVTKLDTATMPNFDILCGGFPCQAFSHAGKQGGFEDTRGTLFRDICRILQDKKPKYFLLENVKNLKGHDNGKTWQTIYNSLVESGYSTYETPIVLSPHQIGVPQHRERVFILGVRSDCLADGKLPPFPGVKPAKDVSITSILLPDEDVPKGYEISKGEQDVLSHWETFVQHFRAAGVKLPTFPIWSDSWDANEDTTNYPAWKKKFVTQNQEFYKQHITFLSQWLIEARKNAHFTGAKRKFEWQCGAFQAKDSLWNCLLQFRPSGIRVKRATYSPALVAMAQIVVVGAKKRKLCPREVARLQSFPDTFKLPTSTSAAYKQFGNSVNVDVIRHMAKFLLSIPTVA